MKVVFRASNLAKTIDLAGSFRMAVLRASNSSYLSSHGHLCMRFIPMGGRELLPGRWHPHMQHFGGMLYPMGPSLHARLLATDPLGWWLMARDRLLLRWGAWGTLVGAPMPTLGGLVRCAGGGTGQSAPTSGDSLKGRLTCRRSTTGPPAHVRWPSGRPGRAALGSPAPSS